MKRIILLLIAGFSILNAQSSSPVLNLTTSVRGDGMGGAYSALGNEADAVFVNPAAINDVKSKQLFTSFLSQPEGIYYACLGYGSPLDKKSSFAVSVGMFDGGSMEINSFDGSSVTKNAQRDLLAVLSYGRQLTKNLTCGASIKYLNSTLAEDYKASAFAADAGVRYAFLEDIVLALSVLNIGTALKYADTNEALPLTVVLGAGCPFKISKEEVISASVDGVYLSGGKLRVNAGAEYNYKDFLYGRAGYSFNRDVGSITIGGGIRYRVEGLGLAGLDYAYLSGNTWFDTHRVSAILKF